MSDYTARAVADVPDIFEGQYPGAMRFLTDHLEAQQIAVTHRLMPPPSADCERRRVALVMGAVPMKMRLFAHPVLAAACSPRQKPVLERAFQ